ncbi:hypothetical protein ES703_52231 [subsurface metagenome]
MRDGKLQALADQLNDIQSRVPFKVSARGWCYQLEGFGTITKAEFDKVERHINTCRERGLLPIDFVAEDDARKFRGVEIPFDITPEKHLGDLLDICLRSEEYYTPDWWDGEDYYIQMVVEKIDLKTLFLPVCQRYHIPIATSRGWSSLLQRAEYARRFKEAEDGDLKCVLLYCGDHDPDGLRISEFLMDNLWSLADIKWADGSLGYYPSALIIDRFGLNADFIEENNLTWIDNLITASKKDLADPSHPNHYLPYVQDYLRDFGARKCEANALVVIPDIARDLCTSALENYLGEGAALRFEDRYEALCTRLTDFRDRTGIKDSITSVINTINNEE